MLREAQLEKARLIESRVRRMVWDVRLMKLLRRLIDPQIDGSVPPRNYCVIVLQERESLARRQILEEERRRREEAEKRLQDETFHRQQLVEKEVKMRAKNFSQVGQMVPATLPPSGRLLCV